MVTSVAAKYTDVDQLRAYFRMNESSGDIINQATSVGSSHSVGSGADMTNNGATYGATGILGSGTALSFDGVNDYLDNSSLSIFNFMHDVETTPISLNVWGTDLGNLYMDNHEICSDYVYPTPVGVSHQMQVVQEYYYYQIYSDTSDSHPYSVNSNSGVLTDYDDGELHMLSTTFDWTLTDSKNVKFYYDGALVKEADKKTYTPVSDNSTAGMHIGSSAAGTNFFWYGVMSELSLWSRVLSASDISDLYNSGDGAVIDGT